MAEWFDEAAKELFTKFPAPWKFHYQPDGEMVIKDADEKEVLVFNTGPYGGQYRNELGELGMMALVEFLNGSQSRFTNKG